MDKPDAPKVRFPPPAVYLGFLMLAPLIERFVTMPRLTVPWPFGAFLTAIGIVLVAVAIGLFRRHGENPEPWTPTVTIVESGLYARTPNPMYLGMAVAYLGVALWTGSMLALAFLPFVIIVIQTQVIAREEAYLSATFGASYDHYRRRVRRWL